MRLILHVQQLVGYIFECFATFAFPQLNPILYKYDMKKCVSDLSRLAFFHEQRQMPLRRHQICKKRVVTTQRVLYSTCSPCLKECKINTPRVSGYNVRRTRHEGTAEGKFTYSCFRFQDNDTASMHDAAGSGTGRDKMQ
jgi:hypothetical protein